MLIEVIKNVEKWELGMAYFLSSPGDVIDMGHSEALHLINLGFCSAVPEMQPPPALGLTVEQVQAAEHRKAWDEMQKSENGQKLNPVTGGLERVIDSGVQLCLTARNAIGGRFNV